MGTRKSYEEVLAEREKKPFDAAPYKAGHKNYLDPSYLEYRPNRIRLRARVFVAFFAAILIAYGVHGLFIDDIFIPGRRSAGIHFQGLPAICLFSAMCLAASAYIALIVDHYDRRDNEATYQKIVNVLCLLALVAFVCANLLHFAGI